MKNKKFLYILIGSIIGTYLGSFLVDKNYYAFLALLLIFIIALIFIFKKEKK